MPDASQQDDDATLRLVQRFKGPVLAVGLVLVAIGQVKKLVSGDPFLVVTGLLYIAFFASLVVMLLRRPMPRVPDDAVAIRRVTRTQIVFWATWLAVALAWLAWGLTIDHLRTPALVFVVIPLVALLLAVLGYVKAETWARRVREQDR